MNRIGELFKTTVIGGFFVILPVALVIFLLMELVGMVLLITSPVTKLLPVESLGGI